MLKVKNFIKYFINIFKNLLGKLEKQEEDDCFNILMLYAVTSMESRLVAARNLMKEKNLDRRSITIITVIMFCSLYIILYYTISICQNYIFTIIIIN
jgi:hypothetical protein